MSSNSPYLEEKKDKANRGIFSTIQLPKKVERHATKNIPSGKIEGGSALPKVDLKKRSMQEQYLLRREGYKNKHYTRKGSKLSKLGDDDFDAFQYHRSNFGDRTNEDGSTTVYKKRILSHIKQHPIGSNRQNSKINIVSCYFIMLFLYSQMLKCQETYL
mgnify:CR=1 FL=1